MPSPQQPPKLIGAFRESTLSGQAVIRSAVEQKRVTVVTDKGDVIEGALKGATDTEVSIEVAGQPVKIPVASIRYLSFIGKINDAGTTAPPATAAAARTVDVALAALRDLRSVTEIGVLRTQYSEKLVSTLLPVKAFADRSDGTWIDLKAALRKATSYYQAPLISLESWSNASRMFMFAAQWADYAALLSGQPNESAHIESGDQQQIDTRGTLNGRLGSGDRQLPKNLLRKDFDGGFSDALQFSLATDADLDVEMSCAPCHAGLVLMDSTGKKIDSDAGISRTSAPHIKKRLPPGRYVLLPATTIDEVGSYKLAFK